MKKTVSKKKHPVNTGRGGARFPNGGGAQPGAGRPPFGATDEERKRVMVAAGRGVPHKHIAALIRNGISLETLYKHFSTELTRGLAEANEAIGGKIYERAMAGEVACMIWWSKSQMRWSEKKQLDVKTPKQPPAVSMTINANSNPSNKSEVADALSFYQQLLTMESAAEDSEREDDDG